MAISHSVAAFTIDVVANSVYSGDTVAMDTALGITGLTIEDFEDTVLATGLSIQHTNPNAGPTNTLTQIYLDGSGSFGDLR